MQRFGLESGAMTACRFFVSNVEVYNERVRDLLVPTGASSDLEIRQDLQRGVHLPTVQRLAAESMDHVLDIIQQGMCGVGGRCGRGPTCAAAGQRNRAQGHTEMNAASSRSHSVVMIDVETQRPDSTSLAKGRLVLVDLAGSERLNKSGVSGERQREAQNINKSLSALGDVIAALGSKQVRAGAPRRRLLAPGGNAHRITSRSATRSSRTCCKTPSGRTTR
jgi:kinesin family protein C2/C3